MDKKTSEILVPANVKLTRTLLTKLVRKWQTFDLDPSPIRNKIHEVIKNRLILSPCHATRPHPFAKSKNKDFDQGIEDLRKPEAGDSEAALRVGIALAYSFDWELSGAWLEKALEGGVDVAFPYLDLTKRFSAECFELSQNLDMVTLLRSIKDPILFFRVALYSPVNQSLSLSLLLLKTASDFGLREAAFQLGKKITSLRSDREWREYRLVKPYLRSAESGDEHLVEFFFQKAYLSNYGREIERRLEIVLPHYYETPNIERLEKMILSKDLLETIERGISANVGLAFYGKGVLCELGLIPLKNPEWDVEGIRKKEVFSYYLGGAKPGHSWSMDKVIKCYCEGIGVAKDEKECYNWHLKAERAESRSAEIREFFDIPPRMISTIQEFRIRNTAELLLG